MNHNLVTKTLSTASADSWQVCGVVVQCILNKLAQIKTALLQLPETEIHAVNEENGKIVVVIQGANQKELAKRMEQARDIDGVITVSLVYHHVDEI